MIRSASFVIACVLSLAASSIASAAGVTTFTCKSLENGRPWKSAPVFLAGTFSSRGKVADIVLYGESARMESGDRDTTYRIPGMRFYKETAKSYLFSEGSVHTTSIYRMTVYKDRFNSSESVFFNTIFESYHDEQGLKWSAQLVCLKR